MTSGIKKGIMYIYIGRTWVVTGTIFRGNPNNIFLPLITHKAGNKKSFKFFKEILIST